MATIQSKNIIVTGASSGIGERMAIHIAKNGGNPVLVARSEEKLRLLQAQLVNDYSIRCTYYAVDLTNTTEWKNCLTEIMETVGQIHAIINNAGIGIFDLVEHANEEDIERMFRTNVFALIYGTNQLLPHLINNGYGHIINIGSQAGKIATPKSAVYGATKHAVIGFSNALRMEVEASGIAVTTVNVGPVRTKFFEIADPTGDYRKSVDRFMLDPDKVAHKVVSALFTDKREINMPTWMNVGSRIYQLFPGLVERLLKKQFNRK